MLASGRKEPVQYEDRDEEKIAMSQEISSILDFVSLYYDNHGVQKFNILSRLYSPESSLIWNGIASTGTNNIEQFFTQLPKAVHTAFSVDTQRLGDSNAQKKFLIQTSGLAKYEDYPDKTFFHTFLISAVGDTYKISLENYRCLEGTP